MPNSLTTSGLSTATQPELLAQFTAALKAIYGPDINLQSNSPDGQLINIFIQSILDVEDLLTQIYNSMDPDNAIGVILDQRVAINGIQRQAGTYTVTNITVTNSTSVNLYGLDQSVNPVYTVSDNSGNEWQLISTQTGLAPGANVLAFRAALPGAVLTIPNTINVPVSIVLGVTSINNPTTYTTLGINEESDAALKLRRQVSVSLSSQGYLQGLLGSLLNINGIVSAFIYENNSSTTDGDGVPGHSIWVIVAGTPSPATALAWSAATTYSYGQLASVGGVNYISWQNNNTNNNPTTVLAFWGLYNPVAQAIYSKRNAGCGMYGSTQYLLTQIDGRQLTINYDTVVAEPLFIKFTATSLDGIHAPNLAAIRSQLVELLVPGVYEEVNINQLATAVQKVDSNTLVTSSGFSTSSGGSYSNTLTPTAKNYQFAVTSADIIILSMILSAPNAVPTIVSGVVTNMVVSMDSGGATLQFTGLGGFGTLVYSKTSGPGSINSVTGVFTSSTVGTVLLLVTDSLGNTATATVTVS